ncbi:MAG TPA: GDL motif peptide-associated radical SAM/SPASM maturase [Bryobacteraceae bacterium]|nr:GDL motif peptide-associated radical SAM/SPASM maturase [Bryobacteraceae bacterium]
MSRETNADEVRRCVPVAVVWELTLTCNLKCQHCGSRAGRPRTNELTTAEALDVVDQLARLGAREIGLIGGEAFLRRDWIQIVRRIASHGIRCAIQTGGRQLTNERIKQAADAGLKQIGVSIDGLEALHDRMRGVPGSFRMAVDALHRARAAGLEVTVNTSIACDTLPDLPGILDIIAEAGVTVWQIQIAVAMGNAVDNDHILMQPYQILDLMPLLARLFHEGKKRGVYMDGGNNIGYFGPYEHLWRPRGNEHDHWAGCGAGQSVIALEADGTVKGCPSLATVGFAGGNVRDTTLEEIWNTRKEIHFARLRSVEDLWGFCRTCYYADVCRAGCTWTSHSLLGRAGNNPYCHYRALELEKRGVRERIAKLHDAPKKPFAIGEFEIILEPIPGKEPQASVRSSSPRTTEFVQIQPAGSGAPNGAADATPGFIPEGYVAPVLDLCRACNQYIFPHEVTCPHCGANVAQAAVAHEEATRKRHALMASMAELIRKREQRSAHAQ